MSQVHPLHHALSLMQQGALSAAETLCQQWLEQRPDDFNARHLLGVIQLQAGDPLSASQTLQCASELPVAARFRAQALSNLALALQQRERPAAALDALREATALLPDEIAFQLNLLGLLEQLQHWQAMLDQAQGLPLLQQSVEAQLLLARAERQLQRELPGFQRLHPLVAHSEDSELLGEWALLAFRSQQHQPLQHQSQAWPVAQLQAIADYLAEEGEAEGALMLYRELLQRDPHNSSVRHLVDAAEGRLAAAAPAEYVRALYDSHAAEFEQHLVGRLGYQAPELLAQRLSAYLPAQLERVTDLGCGSGLLGKALRQHFSIAQLTGCDLSAGMLEQARNSGHYDQLAQQELHAWLAHQGPLQLICASDVLIYTGDLTDVCAAARDSLQPGGWFAFTVEESTDAAVALHSSGRYRHSREHVAQAAQDSALLLRYCEPFPLREESGQMISGLMVLLQHARVPASAE